MRRLPALIAAAALAAVALTGCTAAENTACAVSSGPASDSITATGALNGAVTATVPAPLDVTRTERSTLIQGTGPALAAGQYAQLSITLFDGGTGQPLGKPINTFASDSSTSLQVPGLVSALQCVPEGSRVAIVVPASAGASTLGVQGNDAAVAIVDLTNYFPMKATGRPVVGKPGFPTVSLAPNGNPGVKIPDNQPAPTAFGSETIKVGSGPKITSKDTVVIQYLNVSWDSPAVIGSSWSTDSPSAITLTGTDPVTKSIIGQTIGSQLVLLVPASDSSNSQASVYVIDLLGIQK